MTNLDVEWAKDWMRRSSDTLTEHRMELIDLDRAIGPDQAKRGAIGRHLPQDARFADARITTNLHIASAIQRLARCGNALLPRKYDVAHTVANVGKRQAG